jgi:hypothetical protein
VHNRPSNSRIPASSRALRRIALASVAATLIGCVAALPTGAAAANVSGEAAAPALSAEANVTLLPPSDAQELLGAIPVGEGGIPAAQLEVGKLAKVLAELPGINELGGVSGVGGTSGLTATLRQTLEKLLAGHSLDLGELLSPQALGGGLVEQLEGLLHTPAQPLIETLLGKSAQEVVAGALGSVDLGELLAKVLGSSTNPTQLLDQLLEALSPATLQTLLGSTPTGEPLKNLKVGELADSLSRTPEALAEAVGQTATSLPATAAVVTRALEDGKELGALDGTEGLALALLPKDDEGTLAGGRSSSAGAGGTGGSGGSPGSTTIVVQPASGAAAAPSSSAAKASAGKVKIISHKVSASHATIVVQVPSGGRLTLSGNGVKKVSHIATKAGRITLTTALTKARAATLRKRRRKQTSVKLTAAFAPASGAPSQASTRVVLR